MVRCLKGGVEMGLVWVACFLVGWVVVFNRLKSKDTERHFRTYGICVDVVGRQDVVNATLVDVRCGPKVLTVIVMR